MAATAHRALSRCGSYRHSRGPVVLSPYVAKEKSLADDYSGRPVAL
jgi:hypothetical protein